MMKKVSIIAVLIFTLFVVNVSAGPLNSFAQNPIPYWDNQSTNIDVTWDSTEQTVTIDWVNDSEYWEDMSVVTDWTLTSTEDSESKSTDSDILTFTTDFSGSNDWDGLISDAFTPISQDSYFKTLYKVNSTAFDYLRFYFYTIDDVYLGYYQLSGYQTSTSYEIVEFYTGDELPNLGDIGKVKFYLRGDEASDDIEFLVDYVHIWEITDLNIGVPITLQNQQTIELYVNSTFLNSEVRLEIYDDTEALDTFCVFNSSYVVFQDYDYARTDGLARIEFSLDNERNTGTITVFAENSSLINQYEASILSGTNFLRMIDSVFNGSIILYYLNGDLSYTPELSIIEELFLSTTIIGYLGPLLLVVAGWWLVKKDKGLGVIAFIVESLFVAQYLALVEATPDYWWQILILIFGMLFTVVFPLWDR